MTFQRMLRRASKPRQHMFTRVKNLEFEKDGTVDEFLDQQFTVNYEDGSFGFLFYKDKGDTWRPLDEPKKGKPTKCSAPKCAPDDFITFIGGGGAKVNWSKLNAMYGGLGGQPTNTLVELNEQHAHEAALENQAEVVEAEELVELEDMLNEEGPFDANEVMPGGLI